MILMENAKYRVRWEYLFAPSVFGTAYTETKQDADFLFRQLWHGDTRQVMLDEMRTDGYRTIKTAHHGGTA